MIGITHSSLKVILSEIYAAKVTPLSMSERELQTNRSLLRRRFLSVLVFLGAKVNSSSKVLACRVAALLKFLLCMDAMCAENVIIVQCNIATE